MQPEIKIPIPIIHRMRYLSAGVVIFSLIFVMAWMLRGWLNHNSPFLEHDQVSPNWSGASQIISVYLQALETRNRKLLMSLVPSGYDAENDVNERLRRLGGVRSAQAKIKMSSDISPQFLSVAIRAPGAGSQEYAWTENMFWRDGAWHLVIGGTKRPTPPQSSIESP